MTAKEIKRNGARGQALLMVSIGIAFLLGVLGLVVDVGYGYYLKQVQQAAADAGANAAVIAAKATSGACGGTVLCETGYTCPDSPTNSTNFGVACLYAQANGLSRASGQTVTVSSGTGTPPSVSGLTTTYWVTVTATEPQHLGFLSGLGLKGGNVSSQATGAVMAAAGAGGCIYVLDTTANGALNVSGSGNIYSNCGIYVNSNSTNALISSGGAKTTASVVDVVGNVNISGGSTVTPTPTTGVTAATDPLASLPAPTYSGCNATSKNISATTATISPGVYCGGITISGGASVTFNSGNYILNGGGINVSGNSTVNGSGVFFYNTSNGYSFGPITISGDAGVNFTAPTSGTYEGILFFQDRSISSSASSTFSGGTNSAISGSIYLPTAELYFSGGSSTSPLTMALVAKDLNVSGNAYLAKDPTGALTGMGSVTAAMVQ